MNENDFKKRFGSNSPLPPYSWSDDDYASGWDTTGDMPPTRQQFDALQRTNDEKAAYLLNKVYSSARLLRRSTHYNKGDRVYAEGLKAGLYLECTTAGMSGTDAIDFSSAKVGDTITDGGVKWTVVKYALTTDVSPLASALETPRKIELTGNVTGSADFDGSKDIQIVATTNGSLSYRQPSTTYAVGSIAYHASLPTGYYLECTTGGTTSSGGLTISSPSIGGTVSDGTVTWKVCKDIGTGNAPIYAGFNHKQTFTSSGTFVAPVSGTYKITLQGGGGSGSEYNDNPGYTGDGGGAGAYLEFYEKLIAGQTYTFTVGAGAEAPRSPGGTSSTTINNNLYECSGGNSISHAHGGVAKINGVDVSKGFSGSRGQFISSNAGPRKQGGIGGGAGGSSHPYFPAVNGGGGAGGSYDGGRVLAPGAGGDGYITFEWLS